MRVNAFFTFFSHFFRSLLSGHFLARFLYYTYLNIYDKIFYKKIAYMCIYARVIILKEKASDYLTGPAIRLFCDYFINLRA